jgi:hypothetical protein
MLSSLLGLAVRSDGLAGSVATVWSLSAYAQQIDPISKVAVFMNFAAEDPGGRQDYSSLHYRFAKPIGFRPARDSGDLAQFDNVATE